MIDHPIESHQANLLKTMTNFLPAAPPALPELGEIFGLDGPVTSLTPVAGGWTHRVWRAETSSAVYAVKQFLRDDQPGLGRLQRAATCEMDVWAAGGLRMPRPHVAVDGRIIVDDSPLVDGRVGWVRMHDWVAGTPLRGGVACTPETAYEVGALLARLHRRPAREDTDPDPDPGLVSEANWRDIAEHLDRDDTALSECSARLRALRPFVVEMHAASEEICGEMVLSHGEVNQTNCLRDDVGRIVLLDWDDAGPVDSLRELGYALLEWAGAGRGQPVFGVVREVLRGYTMSGGEVRSSVGSLLPVWVEAAGRWMITNAAIVAQPDGVALDRIEGARFQLAECLDKLERARASWTAWCEAVSP